MQEKHWINILQSTAQKKINIMKQTCNNICIK